MTSNYTKINTAYVTSGSFSSISDIAFDSSYDFGMFPTATGNPNPSGDACRLNTNFNCVLVLGSIWTETANGLFCFNASSVVGVNGQAYGAMAIEF